VRFGAILQAYERGLRDRMGEFECPVHLCLGQEDVPEALKDLLRPEDWLFSTHRSHGHYLAKGGDPDKLTAEIEGREDGINGGFSGSQSFSDAAIRFHSTAIVGGLIGAATGAALALKFQASNALSICCVGDAATEQGVFWESLNFASLHALPIVWVCENNGLSVHSHYQQRQCAPLTSRIAAFRVPVARGVDGLRTILKARTAPAFVEVPCERRCNHVSAMEDLR
jgi:pyruvate dehydrogenase E1 component alpha subunit